MASVNIGEVTPSELCVGVRASKGTDCCHCLGDNNKRFIKLWGFIITFHEAVTSPILTNAVGTSRCIKP